jgi:hypoxanthine phosphoribosyltransferase
MEFTIKSKDYSLTFEGDEELFNYLGFAERENKKRKFLFVSKVLGKHYPSSPQVMKKVFKDLADLVEPNVFNKPLLVIGMGETATGLGWGVYNEINNQQKIYIHTTRMDLSYPKLLTFNEDHSHAPVHFIYEPQNKSYKKLLSVVENILIIDDEVTTGRTIENLKEQLKNIFPHAKQNSICIVRWNLKNLTNLNVQTKALQYPEFILPPKGSKVVKNLKTKTKLNIVDNVKPAINNYGRYGSKRFNINNLDLDISKFKNKKILVVGTGEFNYAAFWLASKISKKSDVYVQSTTRSPIKVSGIIKSKLIFKDNYDKNMTAYLYNVADKRYDVIIIMAETNPGSIDSSLIKALKKSANHVIPIYC